MNVPSVGINSRIFELKFCQRELKLALKVQHSAGKNVNSHQLRPYKKSKVRLCFSKARQGTPPFKLMQVLHKVWKLVRNRPERIRWHVFKKKSGDFHVGVI